MKKAFITPEIGISTFMTDNIITTSGTVSQSDKISAMKSAALESSYMQNVEKVNVIDFTF